MVKSMTVSIREALRSDRKPGFTYGSATIQSLVFRVRWPWLIYPIGIVVLSLIFLITTIILTRNDQAWKSSLLAMMFHAFNDEDRHKFGNLNTIEEMEQITGQQKVRLVTDDDGNLIFKAGSKTPFRVTENQLAENGARLGSHGLQGGLEFLNDSGINA